VIELVPVKVELPSTVVTVKRTEATFLRIRDFETEHHPFDPVVHEDDPLAPLLQLPDTTAPGAGKPSRVIVTVTVAFHRVPLLALDPVSETVVAPVGFVTVTVLEAVPVAPSSSVTVRRTV